MAACTTGPSNPVDVSLRAQRCEKPTIIADAFDIVFFAPGSAVLSSRTQAVLQAKVRLWQTLPLRYVVVTGHTDAAEARTARPSLSVERARAARRYLVAQGLPAERMVVEGVGATDPLIPGNEPEAHNRYAQSRAILDTRAADRQAALERRECLAWVRDHCFTPSRLAHAGTAACNAALSGALQ